MSPRTPPPLPAGVGITDLVVYDWVSPDGLAGGSPHLHTACAEAYCVTAGTGSVQTLGPDGVVRDTDLKPGELVWFTPGVIHRLVNTDGRLRILVVMQNGGLPEAGDVVLTFPNRIMADDKAYTAAASLAPDGRVDAATPEAARKRRDLAVEGFTELAADARVRGPQAMREFYTLAARRVREKAMDWMKRWESGPMRAAWLTGAHLASLSEGDASHLLDGAVGSLSPEPNPRLGMCGSLNVYLPEGAAR